MKYNITIIPILHMDKIHIFLSDIDYNIFHIFFTDEELRKYSGNLKKFTNESNEEYNFLIDSRYYMEEPNEVMKSDRLVFEFETEEEAFYFKLKYC